MAKQSDTAARAEGRKSLSESVLKASGLVRQAVSSGMVTFFRAARAAEAGGAQAGRAGGEKAAQEPDWRCIVDALADVALVLDHEDIVVHFNPSAVDLYPQLRAGVPLSQVSRSPDLHDGVERARDGEERVVVELLDRVPVERRLSAIVSRLSTGAEEDGIPQLLLVFRDITDQEKSAQMRADFIANPTHELRTPLSSLKGFVETLQGPAREDEAARERFLAMMATQATRMTRLIDDLLLLSRSEMSVHLQPRGIVDLCDVIEDVVETLQPMADSNEIALHFHKPPELAAVYVRGERDELMQAFLNLVQNAIKYGGPRGRVEVRISQGSTLDKWRGRIRVSVIDDGPGIAAEHLPRLTERFYRVNVARSREKGGTGLGLAIVKYIVTRHRGELRITSEVGRGSEFTVELDAVDADLHV